MPLAAPSALLLVSRTGAQTRSKRVIVYWRLRIADNRQDTKISQPKALSPLENFRVVDGPGRTTSLKLACRLWNQRTGQDDGRCARNMPPHRDVFMKASRLPEREVLMIAEHTPQDEIPNMIEDPGQAVARRPRPHLNVDEVGQETSHSVGTGREERVQ